MQVLGNGAAGLPGLFILGESTIPEVLKLEPVSLATKASRISCHYLQRNDLLHYFSYLYCSEQLGNATRAVGLMGGWEHS